MGIFSWLMKGVDIQSENESVQAEQNVPVQQQPNNDNQLSNLQQLSKKEKEVTFCIEQFNQPMPSQIDTRLGLNSEKYAPKVEQQTTEKQKAELLVFKVVSIKDIQGAISHLNKGQPCIIDLAKIGKKEKSKLLDYLAGAIFALKGTMHNFKKENYVLSPEGMTISLQEKNKANKR